MSSSSWHFVVYSDSLQWADIHFYNFFLFSFYFDKIQILWLDGEIGRKKKQQKACIIFVCCRSRAKETEFWREKETWKCMSIRNSRKLVATQKYIIRTESRTSRSMMMEFISFENMCVFCSVKYFKRIFAVIFV